MQNHSARLVALLFAMFACVGCDQATKVVATRHLAPIEPISFFGNLFRLEYAENPGAFLSFGASMSEQTRYYIFVVMVSIVLLAAFIFLLRSYKTWPMPALLALVLVISGGGSNLLSRLLNDGHVIDFMNIGIGGLRTGIFNVADMAIMAGVGLLFLFSFRSSQELSGTEPTQPMSKEGQ